MASVPGQHYGGPDASGATLTIDLPKVRRMVSSFSPFQAPAGSPSGRRQEFGWVYGSPMELQPNRPGGLRSLMLLFSSGKYIKSHPCPTSTPTVSNTVYEQNAKAVKRTLVGVLMFFVLTISAGHPFVYLTIALNSYCLESNKQFSHLFRITHFLLQ